MRRDALRVDPVRDVSNLERGERRSARALTVDETRDWLALFNAGAYAVRKDLPGLTRFLLGTGVRIGEALGVHWADVDLDRGVVQVCSTVIRVKGVGLVAKAPKAWTARRAIRRSGSD